MGKSFVKLFILKLFFSLMFIGFLNAQEYSDLEIKNLIIKYKQDARGPYKAVRWFCPDGSTLPPEQRCPEPGGVQRAQFKDEVLRLAAKRNIYLGQILAATPFEDFLDEPNNNSRLKQYQIEKYLRAVDDGWLLRKAQYYRGAFQAEDEVNWGKKFFEWLLGNKDLPTSKFLLLREAAKDIPHAGDDSRAQAIRSVSKNISDSLPSFLDLRVKIHGQPEVEDIAAIKNFREKNISKITPELSKMFDKLIADMDEFFKPVELSSLNKYIGRLPKEIKIRSELENFVKTYSSESFNKSAMFISSADLLLNIRNAINENLTARAKLALLDISLSLETILFKEINDWKTQTPQNLIEKNYYLAKALAGCGYLELWEWEKLSPKISPPKSDNINLKQLTEIHENFKRAVEWSSNLFRAYYENTIELYAGFEPLAEGFLDDKIRSSLLLPFGISVSTLGDFVAEKANHKNYVLGISGQQQARGLNPGYAMGELVVVSGSPENINFTQDKIFVFNKPPSDMKPVAGIATVSEGNLVSHVQLLARNLGIPNAVLSQENLTELKKFNGKKIFYAVSPKGTVVMKQASEMNREEQKLFEKKTRTEDVVTVPVDKLKLDVNKLISLRDLKAKDSGVLCGPKAANLGQLKHLFSERVVEGLVIPFGIFKDHMDQKMPGKSITYWKFLNDAFEKRKEMLESGTENEKVEKFILEILNELQKSIKQMPLKKEFIADLKTSFKKILGSDIGKIPVFIRSDTNMEDLKEFTGAGLNLTVFNVLDEEKIINAIKDVWASPYTERSFKWRQKFLNNPENVYPSILIIPTVDVDISGVMITTGVTSGNKDDITIAFSRGAGGAVEGQLAETYLLKPDGSSTLISPSREISYTTLPSSGGTSKAFTTFEKPLLNKSNLKASLEFANEIKSRLPGSPGIESAGPYDVELGFIDNILWLFQVRPFVESKRAASSAYLNSLDPAPKDDMIINLTAKF